MRDYEVLNFCFLLKLNVFQVQPLLPTMHLWITDWNIKTHFKENTKDNDPDISGSVFVVCFSINLSTCLCFSPYFYLSVYLSLAERRSVVIGSCWMVWCSIRANKPARFVIAVLRFLSCSNSSSSLYHTRTLSRSTSARRSFSQQ